MIQTKPVAEQITPLVQRQGVPEDEELIPEEEEEKEPIQFKANSAQTPADTTNLSSRINSLKGSGQPLPKSARNYFEPRFGIDFSNVRVHSSPRAADTAKSINAQAFTKGRDIIFGTGQYSPTTSIGKRLLGHELTHVVQQQAAHGVEGSAEFKENAYFKQEAQRVGYKVWQNDHLTHQVRLRTSGLHLQRQLGGEFEEEKKEEESCVRELPDPNFQSFLQPHTVTIIEFGSPGCIPCNILKKRLNGICNEYKKRRHPVTIRFYYVDVSEDKFSDLADRYVDETVPDLYIYVGNEETHHSGGDVGYDDYYRQLITENVDSAMEWTRGERTWAGIGLGALGGATIGALFGLGIGAGVGAPGWGALIGGLAGLVVGAIAGGIAGYSIKRKMPIGRYEAEEKILGFYGDFLKERIEKEDLGKPKIKEVPLKDFCVAYAATFPGAKEKCEEVYDDEEAIERCLIEKCKLRHGFYDQDTKTIWLRLDVHNPGLLVHEYLHFYSHKDFAESFRDEVKEGTTEYFTRKICEDSNIDCTGSYGDEYEEVKALVDLVGERPLLRAYFKGDVDGLVNKVDTQRGKCATYRWTYKMILRSFEDAREIIEGTAKSVCPEKDEWQPSWAWRLLPEDWDFTREDYERLQGKLYIASGASWFPEALQKNLLATLHTLLNPKLTPSATEGINIYDFYHGHVAVPTDYKKTEEYSKAEEEYSKQRKKLYAEAKGGEWYGDVTKENLPAFKKAVEALEPFAKKFLEQMLLVPNVAVIYHTFETRKSRPPEMKPRDPRRNWITPLKTNKPEQLKTKPPESPVGPYFVPFSFGFLVDEKGGVHIRPGSIRELSTIIGKPTKND